MTASKLSHTPSSKCTAVKRSLAGRLASHKSQPTLSRSVASTGGRPSTNIKRGVSFEDKVRVIEVQPVDASMKNELFYCRSDYRRFKKESKTLEKRLHDRLTLGSTASFTLACAPNCGSSNSSSSNSSSIPSLSPSSLSYADRYRSLSLESFRLR